MMISENDKEKNDCKIYIYIYIYYFNNFSDLILTVTKA